MRAAGAALLAVAAPVLAQPLNASRARTLHAEGRSVEPIVALGTNRVVSLESSAFCVASAAPHPAE